MKGSKFHQGGYSNKNSIAKIQYPLVLCILPPCQILSLPFLIVCVSVCVCVFCPAWPLQVGPDAEPELIGRSAVGAFSRPFYIVSNLSRERELKKENIVVESVYISYYPKRL